MTSTTFQRGRLDAASHDALMKLFPVFEPPSGDLPNAEDLAAFSEGLLLPDEEIQMRDLITNSPAARAELRHLYPRLFVAMFKPESIEERDNEAVKAPAAAQVLPFPKRRRGLRYAAVGGLLAAAAAAIFLFMPTAPADGASMTIAPLAKTRAAPSEMFMPAMPQERFQLLIKLGEASIFDRLRGHAPFGLLFQLDASGRAQLVCTSDDAECRPSPTTMSYLYQAPAEQGQQRLIFVSGVGSIDRAQARALESENTRWSIFEGRLNETAERLNWTVHEPKLLLVK